MRITDSRLMFFISETHRFDQKQSVAVVGLVGSIVERNARSLQHCVEAIAGLSCQAVILNFRDVIPEADGSTAEWVRRMTLAARVHRVTLRLASLHPELRIFLEGKEVLRPEEVVNNLAHGLEALAAIQKKAA